MKKLFLGIVCALCCLQMSAQKISTKSLVFSNPTENRETYLFVSLETVRKDKTVIHATILPVSDKLTLYDVLKSMELRMSTVNNVNEPSVLYTKIKKGTLIMVVLNQTADVYNWRAVSTASFSYRMTIADVESDANTLYITEEFYKENTELKKLFKRQ